MIKESELSSFAIAFFAKNRPAFSGFEWNFTFIAAF